MRLREWVACTAVAAWIGGGIAETGLAQGAKASKSFETRTSELKPGEFIWDDRVAPAGPMVLLVNLKTQRAYAYRNGVRIGASTVSTGKDGHKTPTGVFTILQKNKDHVSNIYKGAKMPYMQRLTWDGIALHAGNLPGYPASHGCVRLPLEFSKKLFETTSLGMTVVVVDEAVTPKSVADDAVLAPVGPKGQRLDAPALALGDRDFRWEPQKSPSGPVTVVFSTESRIGVVYRNGVEIGRTKIAVPEGFDIGTRVVQFSGFDANGEGTWMYIGIPGYAERDGQRVEPNALRRITVPEGFRDALRSVIVPGTTIMGTDGPISDETRGAGMTILTS